MTQHSGFQVFMAAAVGAFIGSFVGLQFTPPLWWIGMFIGGAVGYLAYDPMAIVHALPQASRFAASRTTRFVREVPDQLIKVMRRIGNFFLILPSSSSV